MNMETIEVPDYVADDFNRPLTHPSVHPRAVDVSIERTYLVVNEALKGLDWPDWEIDGHRYHSRNDEEPYGFARVRDKFYIYSEERGRRCAIAIFKNDHMAANYFVWLVSGGARTIDWGLFLDLEP